MACVTCGGWPDPEDTPGCCTIPPEFDADTLLGLWEGTQYLIAELIGPCWLQCVHTASICRPCRCPESCNPCGCCFERAQVPWLCATIDSISSQGVPLDPADWRLEAGYLWPISCEWPCSVDLTLTVGDVPPAGLLVAAKRLLCMLVAQCDPGTCALPQGTVSVTGPDGVTVNIKVFQEWLAENRTGINLIDALLHAYQCPADQPRMYDPVDYARSSFV